MTFTNPVLTSWDYDYFVEQYEIQFWNTGGGKHNDSKILRDMIWWLFDGRCANCKMPGQEVNEIIPRSRSKDAVRDWRNRILLCKVCHNSYHEHGVTDEKIELMREQRKGYLMMIGREAYV